jgi:hypothetical protein
MYVPRPSKFQTNERSLDVARLEAPPALSRCEFPVHERLEQKKPWDPATGAGGDPYGVAKANQKKMEKERVRAMAYSRNHPPKNRTETLMQREERFMRESRKAKEEARARATPFGATAPIAGAGGSSTGLATTWAAGNSAMSSAGWSAGSGSKSQSRAWLPLSSPDREAEGARPRRNPYSNRPTSTGDVPMSMKVPARKTTTWSLGGF